MIVSIIVLAFCLIALFYYESHYIHHDDSDDNLVIISNVILKILFGMVLAVLISVHCLGLPGETECEEPQLEQPYKYTE